MIEHPNAYVLFGGGYSQGFDDDYNSDREYSQFIMDFLEDLADEKVSF